MTIAGTLLQGEVPWRAPPFFTEVFEQSAVGLLVGPVRLCAW